MPRGWNPSHACIFYDRYSPKIYQICSYVGYARQHAYCQNERYTTRMSLKGPVLFSGAEFLLWSAGSNSDLLCSGVHVLFSVLFYFSLLCLCSSCSGLLCLVLFCSISSCCTYTLATLICCVNFVLQVLQFTLLCLCSSCCSGLQCLVLLCYILPCGAFAKACLVYCATFCSMVQSSLLHINQ